MAGSYKTLRSYPTSIILSLQFPFKQIKDKDVTLLDLSGSPVTLDTLSLLEHAAQDDADGEEEDGCRDARRRVVVLDTSSAVGAVGPVKEYPSKLASKEVLLVGLCIAKDILYYICILCMYVSGLVS